jgi:DNA-binding LacI/PurR family transcriptional regulator
VSTVDQHVADQAVAAAQMAVGLLGGTAKELDTTVTPHLVPRGTTAAPA